MEDTLVERARAILCEHADQHGDQMLEGGRAADALLERLAENAQHQLRDEFPEATDAEIRAAFAEASRQQNEDHSIVKAMGPIIAKAKEITGREDFTFREACEIVGYDDPDVVEFMDMAGRFYLRRDQPEGTA